MLIIIRLLYGIFDTLLKYMFYQCYFNKKSNVSKKTESITIITLIIFDVFTKNYFNNTIINLLVTTFVVYALCLSLFEEKLELKLLVSTMVLFFTIIIESVISFPINFIFHIDSKIEQNTNLLSAIVTIIYLFIEFIIVQQIRRRKKMKTLNAGDRKSYLKLIIIPLISIAYIVIFVYLEIISGSLNFLQCYLTIIMLLIINITHYTIYENNEKLYQQNYENLLISQKYEYREEYYKSIEQHQKEIRMIKHDLKNQLIRISAYNNQNAKNEIEAMIDDLVKKDKMFFTLNIGINTLLYVKYKEAVNNNIDCKFNIKLPEKIKISEKDLTVLLGNILDNAIEGCERHIENRMITLDVLYYGNSLYIRIENSTDGRIKNLNTRKSNPNEHGLGSKSVQLITERYNGDLKYKIGGNLFQLEINLWTDTMDETVAVN